MFNDTALLVSALTHRSYANEMQSPEITDNERLEFLGDAILGMVISHYLVWKYPLYSEGKLSKLKSYLVSRSALAGLARNLNLGEYLRLGKGEMTASGHTKDSLLANTFEAVIGAIYLDGGVENVKGFILQQIAGLSDEIARREGVENYKGALQELVQTELGQTPIYQLLEVTGPQHRRIFRVQLKLSDEYCVTAQGYSKKQAEQEAARLLFQRLKLDYTLPETSAEC